MPDLRLLEAEPSEAERGRSTRCSAPRTSANGRTARDDRTQRHLLLPALRAAQRRVGWVSEGALGYASRRLAVPPAEAYGVASFYALLALEERPADVTHVCTDLSCALEGRDRARRARMRARASASASARPLLPHGRGREAARGADPVAAPPLPQAGEPGLRLLRRIAAGVDPESIDAYVQAGGFESLRRARELGAGGGAAARWSRRGCSAAAARRSRPASSGRRSRSSLRSRTTSSATPTSRSRERSRTAS